MSYINKHTLKKGSGELRNLLDSFLGYKLGSVVGSVENLLSLADKNGFRTLNAKPFGFSTKC